MAQKIKVSWLGENIKENENKRLVTDEQIKKWNTVERIDNLDAEEYIELNKDNIYDYCAERDPGDWADLGFDKIFDSSTLQEGNYVIKLGESTLVPNKNTVTAPAFIEECMSKEELLEYKRLMDIVDDIGEKTVNKDLYDYCIENNYFSSEDYPYDENGNWADDFFISLYANIQTIYQAQFMLYLNYLPETYTLIFLCQFFETEFGIDFLLEKLKEDYNVNLNLIINNELNIPNLNNNVTNSKFLWMRDYSDQMIVYIDKIRIKIKKEQYGDNNDKYVYRKYIYFDLLIYDYTRCYNYELNYPIEELVAMEEEPEELLYIPCDDMVGVPQKLTHKATSCVQYYTEDISKDSHNTYILDKYIAVTDVYNYIVNQVRGPYNSSVTVIDALGFYYDINNTSYIDAFSLYMNTDTGYSYITNKGLFEFCNYSDDDTDGYFNSIYNDADGMHIRNYDNALHLTINTNKGLILSTGIKSSVPNHYNLNIKYNNPTTDKIVTETYNNSKNILIDLTGYDQRLNNLEINNTNIKQEIITVFQGNLMNTLNGNTLTCCLVQYTTDSIDNALYLGSFTLEIGQQIDSATQSLIDEMLKCYDLTSSSNIPLVIGFNISLLHGRVEAIVPISYDPSDYIIGSNKTGLFKQTVTTVCGDIEVYRLIYITATGIFDNNGECTGINIKIDDEHQVPWIVKQYDIGDLNQYLYD